MKKRGLSFVLTLCMMLTMMPTNAWVASGIEVSAAATEILIKCTSAAIVTDTTRYTNLVSDSEVGEVVKLTGDCELTGDAINLTANQTITLDLNGYVIKRSIGSLYDDTQAVFKVSNGALNIVDTSNTTRGSIYNAYNDSANGSGILQTGGTVNLYSGTILAKGQAFNLDGKYGTFNMYGGQLIGIGVKSTSDKGPYTEALTANYGTFNIYAGYLTGADADFWQDTTRATGNLQGGYYHDDSMAAYVAAGSTLAALSASGLPDVTISAITGVTYTLTNWVYKTTTSGISLAIPDTANSGDQLKAEFQLIGSNTETFLTASYKWQRSQDLVSWSDIPGATSKYYTIEPEDAGNKLRVIAKIGGNTLTSGSFNVYPKQLVNGSFEYPTITPSAFLGTNHWMYYTIPPAQQELFGWKKTGTSQFEFGSSDRNVSGWGIGFFLKESRLLS